MSGAIFSTEPIVEVNREIIEDLKSKANGADDRKFRFCLHTSAEATLHQSVIVFCKDAYIRPHRHPVDKAESYQIIEGEMTVYFFDDNKNIIRKIDMGERESGKTFFYRLGTKVWHMPVPKSKYVVFHETSLGPYNKEVDVEFADWSPTDKDVKGIADFLKGIKNTNEVKV